MLAELHLYFELLIYLVGTFLYRFLTRELLRRPQVLPDNWPLRAVLVSLTLWYGLTLLDQTLQMLLGLRGDDLAAWGTAIDLIRAWAWLASFAFLVHTFVCFLIDMDSGFRSSPLRHLPVLGYLSLLIFVPAAIHFAQAGEPTLARATSQIFPMIAAYATIMLALTGSLILRLLKRIEDAWLAGFLRLLIGVLALMAVLLGLGAWRDPWATEPTEPDRIVRTLLLGGLLIPGSLFAYYVQRYNVLRLSLSHRTLRHFTVVLVLVVLVMLGAPTLGLKDLVVFRRFIAWGLLLALFLGLAYQPLVDRAARRSTAVRRFLGKSLAPQNLEHLLSSIEDASLDEATMLSRTAAELGHLLGADAEFVTPTDEGPYAPFWNHYDLAGDAPLAHRLDPPNAHLALLLDQHRLHAVFPLRVEGRLSALLVLSVSTVGGGYDMAEIEAIQLLIRQLAGTLALRRLTEARLAEERLLAERADHERLHMLGLVAASVAHEVKNPLSSMKVLAQALREDLAGDENHVDGVADLDVILEQIDRLHRTTQEILGLARPRKGDTTDLTALVKGSLYVLKAEAKKRGVDLDGTGIEQVGEVQGSETAWQTVVFNLMLNAVEHTPAGQTAHVRLHASEEGVVLATRNPGEPIDSETAERLFEPFVSEGGTGLGLALVQRRIEEIGATVEIRDDDGQVVFAVTLPPDQVP